MSPQGALYVREAASGRDGSDPGASRSKRLRSRGQKSRDQVLVTTGLSLSGGGIRSACFNLGVLEGLDRLAYEPPEKSLHATSMRSKDKSHLEYFDYISSVSGGSYAAGHLATAMLPLRKIGTGDGDEAPAWLGNVDLTSKTIPGWLWGVGVWFLGVAFQLLKTGRCWWPCSP